MKTFRIVLLLFFGSLLLYAVGRIGYAYWFVGRPIHEMERYVSGLNKIDTWSYEYIHNGVWTATDGTIYTFQSCDVAKLDSSTYNLDCGCFQWKNQIGESWYTISICPKTKEASCEVYFHSLLDILGELMGNLIIG